MSLLQESPRNNLDLIRYQNEIGEPVKLGEALTIVGHPFAEPINNDQLLQIALKMGLPESQASGAQKAIATTGFTNRFFSHFPGTELDTPGAVERTVKIAGILLKKTLEANGWQDGIDVFIDTSAFLPSHINKQILEDVGLKSDRILSKSYRYACAGAVGAFIDCLSDPSLRNARIVIAALEPLSLLNERSTFMSPKGLTIPGIFGDANTLLAFTPNRFNLQNKRIHIQSDKGVIRLKTHYNFEEEQMTPEDIPDYYTFGEGGREIFRYSKNGAYLKVLPTGTNDPISMDGMATGFFFGDQTTAVITSLLKENGNKDLLKELNGKNVIMHAASKPVVDRIAKLLYRGEYRYLDTPSLPFLMDLAGQSNGSSATTINRWRYMIQYNLIDTRKPMLWIAPGIGSAIAGAIGTINP